MGCLTGKSHFGTWQDAGCSRLSSGPANCFFGEHPMKLIDVSTPKYPCKYVIVDDIDYDNVMRFPWCLHKRRGQNLFYAHCKMCIGCISGKQVHCHMLLHRFILKPPRDKDIDHKDHNGLNCRRGNIRICTSSQNMQNQESRSGSSQYKGVSWRPSERIWTAQISMNHVRHHLGCFRDEIKAAKIYDAKAIELFGDFACTNF